jgi:hypothetical protein
MLLTEFTEKSLHYPWILNPQVYPSETSSIEASTPLGLSSTTATGMSNINITATPDEISLPILSQDNAKEVLTLFVKNNGGCKLPCLMGLTPGENDKAVYAFGTYFQKHSQTSKNQINGIDIVGHLDENSGGTLLVFWENRIRVQIGIGAALVDGSGKIDHMNMTGSVYQHHDDIHGNEIATLLYQHPYFENILGSFSLANILAVYGEPSEIWIMPFPLDNGYSYDSSKYPFDFVLLYQNKGFAIEYITRVIEEDGYLTGCPDVDYVQLSTWNPDEDKNFDDVAQYFSGTDSLSGANADFFKPLQEVTALSVKDFYKYFIVPGNDRSIRTPKNKWP